MYIIEIYDRIGRHWNELKRFNSFQEREAATEYEKIGTAFPSWTVRLVEVLETKNHPE